MKRRTALFIAGCLTTIFGLIFMVLLVMPLSRQTSQPTPEITLSGDMAPVEAANQESVQPTNYETAWQSREATLQAQINDRQVALSELDSTSQEELAQLQHQLVDLQAQVEQTMANIQAAQTQGTGLEQAIEADGLAYEQELATIQANMAEAERQFQQQIQAATNRLEALYNARVEPQAVPPPVPAPANTGRYQDDDDDDDHYKRDDDDRHDDDDDDDDDDD